MFLISLRNEVLFFAHTALRVPFLPHPQDYQSGDSRNGNEYCQISHPASLRPFVFSAWVFIFGVGILLVASYVADLALSDKDEPCTICC